MFIGHYGAALALKGVERKASLGWLFLAVQLADIVLFPLVLLGVEQLNIVRDFTPSTHFELPFIPYTHSLVGSLAWAAAAYLLARSWLGNRQLSAGRIASVMGAAVFSHWVLDLIVHTPDLPLLGDRSPKLGLGLWNNATLTFGLEAALLLAGVWLYMRATEGMTGVGKYGVPAFAVFLILLNVLNIFGPPPESIEFLAGFSLVVYLGSGSLAFWLDRQRT